MGLERIELDPEDHHQLRRRPQPPRQRERIDQTLRCGWKQAPRREPAKRGGMNIAVISKRRACRQRGEKFRDWTPRNVGARPPQDRPDADEIAEPGAQRDDIVDQRQGRRDTVGFDRHASKSEPGRFEL